MRFTGRATLILGAAMLLAIGVTTAATTPSRNMSTYVLLGLDSIIMKEFAFTNVGHVGVSNAGGTMAWGRESFFNDGSQVVTDVLKRAGEKSSLYDLFANTVTSYLVLDGITIRNHGPMAWSPLPLLDPLPATPSCTPGSSAVLVEKYAAAMLGPGAYGNAVVKNGATLTLTGGAYCFADLKVGRKVTIVADAPVQITVMGKVRINPGSRLLPGAGLGASDIEVGVAGKQVKLSHKTKIFGVFYAPNALLRFGRGGSFTGQFAAKDLRSDFGDTFTLEVCGNGIIDPGEQCDEGESGGPCCTASCDFRPPGTPCPDGTVCNGNETCSAFGQCVPGTPLNCTDNNVCTDDVCHPMTGCGHTNNTAACTDNNACTTGDQCTGGSCQGGPPPDCSDGNPCTMDGCHPLTGCQSVGIPGCCITDSQCADASLCTTNERCVNNACVSDPVSCNDDNVCTADACLPSTGCVYTSTSGAPCNDDDACTVNDVCMGSACGGFVLGCDDGDPCTTDACSPASGCTHTAIPGCGALCTLTQGAYGVPGGIANGPQGWITNHPDVLPAFIGAPGTGSSVTVATQSGLEAFLPTGGTPNQLCGNPMPVPCPGDLIVSGAADVPDPSGDGSGGDGAGSLAGQTLAMTLSVALSNSGANPPGLGNHVLTASFCTCDALGSSEAFGIPQCILDNAVTVNNLLLLANQALRGVPLGQLDAASPPCLTYSAIATALDALNRGFDECRTPCSCGP